MTWLTRSVLCSLLPLWLHFLLFPPPPALPYQPPWCTFCVPCTLLPCTFVFVFLFVWNALLISCMDRLLILSSNVILSLRSAVVILFKFYPVFCQFLPCVLSLSPLPPHYYLLTYITSLLLLLSFVFCHWRTSYAREEFWSFIYWCIPDIRSSTHIQLVLNRHLLNKWMNLSLQFLSAVCALLINLLDNNTLLEVSFIYCCILIR